jgi:hypothetical protein
MSSELTGGQMTWADAVAGPLAAATCLWQDLDGLHAEPAPQSAPPTSILWGWRDNTLIRVRLDGETAYVAVLSPAAAGTKTVPWDLRPGGDGRVAGIRGPAVESGAANGRFEQVIVDSPGDGRGPVTFIRPAPHG